MSRNELPSIFTWTIIPKNRRVLKKTQLSSKGEKLRSQPREKDPVLDSNECEKLEGDAGRDPGEVKWVKLPPPPFSEPPSFFFFSYPTNIEIIFDFSDFSD